MGVKNVVAFTLVVLKSLQTHVFNDIVLTENEDDRHHRFDSYTN